MYSEEIEHLSKFSDVNTHKSDIRNTYFENRSCLTNVLDFLNQEVIIAPSDYFSYVEGYPNLYEDGYLDYDLQDDELNKKVDDVMTENRRCIFTNKDMEEGNIIGTVFWVENFNQLLKKFENENLKRICKAIVHPQVIKPSRYDQTRESRHIDVDFFISMKLYEPEIVFEYTIDSYMENICLDVYNKLVKENLDHLVDKYMPKYEKCDGYGSKGEQGYSTELCKCGGLRALCYLDL